MLTPHRAFLDEPRRRRAGLVVDTRNVIPDDAPIGSGCTLSRP